MEVNVTVINPDTWKFEVSIPEEAWTPVDADEFGDDWLTISSWDAATIAGVPFHIHAYRVVEGQSPDEFSQMSPRPDLDADLDRLAAITGEGAGPFMTHKIRGNDYVVLLYPFSQ